MSTSSKKWTYVPGKVINLPPLDIEAIRKQLLEVAKEEASMETLEEENQNIVKDHINDCLEKNQKKQVDSEQPFKLLKPVLEEENDENVNDKEEPLNLSVTKKTNDSFDLDFSALSINTPPVKRKDPAFSIITPKINIIPASETKKLTTPKTINIARTNHFSLQMPCLFKTPQNKPFSISRSTNKQITPYQRPKIATPLLCKTITEAEERNCGDELTAIKVNDVEYVVINLLGKGGSSTVYLCFNPSDKVPVAIKYVPLTNPDTAESCINEVKLLASLQKCNRIIKMYDYEIVENEKLLVVLEKGGEDLHTTLKHLCMRQSHLPVYMILFYWMEMLYAVQQIHMNGIIHSDLKPANFLRAECGLMLIDFGIASKVQEDMTCVYKSHQEGSSNYMSPEALLHAQTSKVTDSPEGRPKYKVHYKSDVWSLGCILYQLVYRRTPFQQINPLWAKLSAITNPNHKIDYPEADWVSPKIISTIKSCLQYNVKARPSVSQLIDEYEKILKHI